MSDEDLAQEAVRDREPLPDRGETSSIQNVGGSHAKGCA